MNINPTQILSQIVMFAVFVWFCARFIWPPLMRAIENRQKQIAEARGRAADIVGQAEKRASQLVNEAKVAAKEEGNREKAAAKAEIEQEYARAREQLREQVAVLAVAGAEKILRREVDAKAHGDLLAAIRQQL